jgi:purine nucleosidase
MAERILLDTDIGSDIDDAVCLAWLLARRDCELAGITTVSGEPERRAAIADALCRTAGARVPIHAGSPLPLLGPQQQGRAPQADVLREPARFQPGTAVEFMRKTIRANPGQLTLLAIGPLTNVALAFRVDPELPGMLKRLVLMCGRFLSEGTPEWNARCDPHATAIVYAARPPVHRSVGLDVTLQLSMDPAEVRCRLQHPRLRLVADLAEVWFQNRSHVVFHDPLAAMTIVEPDVCSFAQGTVGVELSDASALGRTKWQPDGASAPHEVATRVDAARFFELYFGAFG